MVKSIKHLFITLISAILFASIALTAHGASANPAAVRVVLFYSPSCGHCEKVITQDLPPLQDRFKDQLIIAKVDVTQPSGSKLYQKAIQTYNIPDDRLGVPTLIAGDNILVGDIEIPEQLPGIIEDGLKVGGLAWPKLSGLNAYTDTLETPTEVEQGGSWLATAQNRFLRDPQGNTLAVVVLLGMLASLFYVAYLFVFGDASRARPWPGWVIPTLSLIGMFVAIYLTFIETTQATAICGPIGDCNSVQQSPYAMLFGFLPVGVLGLLGYIAILILWVVQAFASEYWKRFSWIMIWVLSIFGVLFSIYLTFLEPFVIGATCIWCITSAIVMTLLMWAATPLARTAMGTSEFDDGNESFEKA